MKVIKHLSIIVIALLLVSFPSCKYFKGKKKDKTMELWQAKQDSIRVADSIRRVQEQLMAIEQARADSIRTVEEQRMEMEKRSKYNIIVGSFVTPEYAVRLADVYRGKGYDTKIIQMEGSRFELVSAESHENFRQAVTRLKEFQNSIEFDAWLYIVK